MNINAKIDHVVEIDPKDVIFLLLDKELGKDKWVTNENGINYINSLERGYVDIVEKTEIDNKKASYIRSLENILIHLMDEDKG